MKNIILFYQVINREKNACEQLKIEIEKLGGINVYIYSIDFENDIALKLSKKINIDMIIMPWIYHPNNYQLLSKYIDRNPNIKIVNLHHEQIASKASLSRMLPTGELAKNSVLHFTWGDYFKDALIKDGVKKEYVFITGNIRADRDLTAKYDKSTIANKFNLDSSKKWLLYSENRGWIYTNNSKKEDHMVELGYTRKDVEDRKKITLRSLEKTLKQINELNDIFFEKFELIYRPHPGTEASLDLDKRVHIIGEYPIEEWLSHVDLNMVWSSTTIFESDSMKVPSIVHEPIDNLPRHKTFGLEKYQTIRSLEELNDNLIDEYYNIFAPKEIYKEYIGNNDGKVTEGMAKLVHEIVFTGIKGYKAKPIKRRFNLYYRQLAFQKITRIMIKLNLLRKLKIPKSAYELRKEIPYVKK